MYEIVFTDNDQTKRKANQPSKQAQEKNRMNLPVNDAATQSFIPIASRYLKVAAVTGCGIGLLVSTGLRADARVDPLAPPDAELKEKAGEVGPDFRVWSVEAEKPDVPALNGAKEKGPSRKIIELSTGMNYFDGKTWRPSVPEFVLRGNEFVADRVQHSNRIQANLNVGGAVMLKTPDGKMLNSTPVAIALYEPADGNFAVIGEITNCTGNLVSSNVLAFESAFSGEGGVPLCASVVYTIEQGRFMQDVVFTGRIDPSVYGFSTNSRLQIITELYQAPDPDRLEMPIYIERDQDKRSRMVSPDLTDETIGFGEFVIGVGYAYTQPTDKQPNGTTARVAKEFRTDGDRQFLVESVPYEWLREGFESLPDCGGLGGGGGHAQLRRVGTLKKALAEIASPPRPHELAKSEQGVFGQTSKRGRKPVGVTIDYIAAIGGTMTGAIKLSSTTNYFVSGTVNWNGPVTIDGGAIFKFRTNASIFVNSTLSALTSSYRPVVMTAVDDNSIGDSFSSVTNSGYTGVINSNGYANPALYVSSSVTLNNFRFCYARIGVQNVDPFNLALTLNDAQFLSCVRGISLTSSGSGTGAGTGVAVTLNNTLMANVTYPVTLPDSGFSGTCSFVNCTFDRANTLMTGSSINAVATNSIFANVTSLGVTPGGNHNGFYVSPQFGISTFTNTSNPFQTVGAASYYLSASGFRDVGVSTGIASSLLSDLKLRTTYPPSVILQSTINSDLTLSPQGLQDTNAIDLGVHYSVLDYALGWNFVTNATLNITAGTAVATFGTNVGTYGVAIGNGGKLLSQGTPTQPVWIVQYNTVQEGSTTNWQRTTYASVASEFEGLSPASVINCRFTDWSILSLDAPQFYGPTNNGSFVFQDCEFHGGKILSGSPTINFTNCLLDRVYTDIEPKDGAVSYFRNNLVYGGVFGFAPTNSHIRDNLFDQAVIPNWIGGWGNTYTGGYNAFITNCDRLQPTSTADIILATNAVAYKVGPLGSFYQATNSPLANAGSTNADKVALYHYTISTNYLAGQQIKETNSIVDVGYHYVAIGTNGLPIDSNGDGVPDYLSDRNGNGLHDPGETNWYYVMSIKLAATNVNYIVGASPIPIDSGATVTDTNCTTFNVGTLTVSIVTNVQPEDTLMVNNVGTNANQIGTSGTNVFFGGTNIGGFTGGVGTNSLVVTLNTNCNLAALTNLIQNITYHYYPSTNEVLAWRTAQFVVKDCNNETSIPVAKTISLICPSALNVMLVVDTSLSMDETISGGGKKIEAATNGAISFVQSMQTGDLVGLVTFDGSARTLSPLTNNFSYVEGRLASLSLAANTDTGDGIQTAQADFPTSNAGSNVLNVMILLTDGVPNAGGSDPIIYTITNASAAKQAGTRLITIGIGLEGQDFNPALLQLIASAPDDYHYASNSSVVAPIYAAIAQSMCHQTQSVVINITSPTNSQVFSLSPTNITVSATGYTTVGTITNVAFYANSTNFIGSVANPSNQFQFLWTNVTAGTYSLTAKATNSAGGTGSSTVTNLVVNALPIVVITNPLSSQVFMEVTNITLKATNYDADGVVTNVQFYCNGTNLPGPVVSNAGYWSLTWSNLHAGTNPITAIATDNRGASASSGITLVKVTPTNPPPTVAITYPASNAVFRAGADITILASATNFPAFVTNVEFFVDGQLLGGDPTTPFGIEQCCWKPGTYVLSALAIDSLGSHGVSSPVTITIAPSVPTTAEGYWDSRFTFPLQVNANYNGDQFGSLHALKLNGTDLYVGGRGFSTDPLCDSLMKWDGAAWTGFGDTLMYCVNAIALDGTNLYIGGKPQTGNGGLKVWAGGTNFSSTDWQDVTDCLANETVRTIFTFGTDLYVGGDFASDGYIVRLNHSTLSCEPVGDGLTGPVYAIAAIGSRLFVGGIFTNSGANSNLSYVAELQGDHWVNLGTGLGLTNVLGDQVGVYALTACGTNLFVGGNFDSAGDNTNANGIAVWNGTSWATVQSGILPNPGCDDLSGSVTKREVHCIAARGNSIFVGGQLIAAVGGASQSYQVARATWSEDRQEWSWAGLDQGLFRDYNSGVPLGGNARAMAILEGTDPNAYDLFVAGEFVAAGSLQKPVNYVARWRVGVPMTQPTVAITNPVNLAMFTNTVGFNISLAATASSNISFVEFYVEGKDVGSGAENNGVYTLQWPNAGWTDPTNGVHWLKAAATDNDGIVNDSSLVLIDIKGTNRFAVDDSYVISQSSPPVTLSVLTNDAPGLRITQVTQLNQNLGRAAVGHDGSYISYAPFINTFGTDRFAYTITNAQGQSDTAWVTVRIRSNPTVQIVSPADGSRFRTNTSVTVWGSARDWDGSVANVKLYTNGIQFGSTLTPSANGNFTNSFIQTARGFYTFEAVATDDEGGTNISAPATIVLTNSAASSHLPVATISNLDSSLGAQTLLQSVSLAEITDGLYALHGQAYDADAGDAVSYQVLLFRPEDYDLTWSENLNDLVYATAPFADVTPGPLNYQHFHIGGDTNGALGTLDLTRIPNGIYDLVLRVRGGTDETNAFAHVRLNSQLKVGQFSFTEQDLVIPVNGIPLTVTRTYNSMNPRSADFGYAWSYALNSMDIQLDDLRQDVTIGDASSPFADDEQDDNGLPKVVNVRVGGGWDVSLNLPDGRRTTFAFSYHGVWPTLYAKWTAPPDVHATLTMLGNNEIDFGVGGFAVPTWADSDLTFGKAPFENQDVRGWELTTQDGTVYTIERGAANNVTWDSGAGSYVNARAYGPPALTKITQRTGDYIQISPTGIAHYNRSNVLTRSVAFERDSQNRIVAIHDPISGSNGLASVKYVYHADTGNLLQVLRLTDRTAGTYVTNKYHYDLPQFPHYITSIEDPRGVPVAKNYYDDSGRLWKIEDGDGKVTQFIHNTSNQVEIVVDRLGHTNSHAYDLRGNVLASTNALNEFTLMTYDTNNNNLLTTSDSLNHTNWFVYDGNGNQLSVANALGKTNLSTFDSSSHLTGTRDPLGNWSTNLHDEFGNLTNTVQKDPNGNTVGQSSSIYDGGLLVASLDANNHTNSSFVYDGSGNVQSSTDARNLTRTFGYDENGNQTNTSYTWTGPSGTTNVSTSTIYDALGRVILAIDALGNTNQTFYNAAGKVDYTIDKLGNTNRFFYDVRGNTVQTIGADGLTNRNVYNDDAKPIYTMDRNGITGTRTDYDAAGRVTNVVRLTNISITISAVSDGVWSSNLGSAGTPYSTNSTEYFSNGWVKSRTGPDGQKTSYTYWDDGQTKTVTDALTNVTYYEYDDAGRQKLVSDALNHTNQFVFDAVGRNAKTIFADNTFVTNIFNLLGQQIGKIDQATVLVSNVFDVAGQLTNVVMPSVPDPEFGGATNNPTWTYLYDDYSQQYAMQDAKGRITTNTFDQFGRPIATRLPLSQTNWIKYNALGQVSNQFDFKGQLKLMRYDRLGRPATNFWFEAGASYPSNSVEYYYNSLGQLTNITERAGTNASSTYFASAKPPRHRNRYFAFLDTVPPEVKGGVCGFALAAVGTLFFLFARLRVTAHWVLKRFSPSVSSVPSVVKSSSLFAYLACFAVKRKSHSAYSAVKLPRLFLPGRFWRFASYLTVISLLGSDPRLDFWSLHAQSCDYPSNDITNPSIRYTNFTYDFDGHLTQVNSPEGVINYGYDLATGRQTSTCTTNSFVAYDYDQLGRLKTVSLQKRNGTNLVNFEVTTNTYTAVGNLSSVSRPNGVLTTYLYDSLNRLTNLTHKLGANLLASYSYQLHPTGRRTNAVEIIKTEDTGTPWITNTFTWWFDGMYRLTNEVLSCSVSGNTYTNQYQYDKVGNRWSKTKLQNGVTTLTTNQFNANDQLLKEVTSTNGVLCITNLYNYDNNGSVIAKTNISAASATTLYTYDLKNKLSSVSDASGVGGTNYFLYNDSGARVRSWNSLGGSPTLYLVDANNHTGYAQVLEELTARDATATRSYVIGDDVLGQTSGSAVSWLLYDGHGSTRQLAGTSGAISARYNYDAYGSGLDSISSSSAENASTRLLYCGEQFDGNLHQYYLRARYYDQGTGRFNAMDSFRGNNFDPQSLHKYGYAHGDSIDGVDPSGEWLVLEILIDFVVRICVAMANMVRSLAVLIAKRLAEKWVFIISGAASGFVGGYASGLAFELAGMRADPLLLGVIGAITGAIKGLVSPLPLKTSAVFGFVSAMLGTAAHDYSVYGSVSWGKAMVAGCFGAAAGILGSLAEHMLQGDGLIKYASYDAYGNFLEFVPAERVIHTLAVNAGNILEDIFFTFFSVIPEAIFHHTVHGQSLEPLIDH
jgi:RHS repeat-associated protein